MKNSIYILSILVFTFFACTKNNPETIDNSPNATVLVKGLDCGNTYLIQFDDDVSGLPQNSWENIFYALNLPESCMAAGKRVYLEFREPKYNEWVACTTLGPGYPQVYIIKVE
ncbi:MAG: hypothetical protein KDC09_16315 [Bacteroidales bacterium]|nr:hypothetical protein [Bacteroidales bacterium]